MRIGTGQKYWILAYAMPLEREAKWNSRSQVRKRRNSYKLVIKTILSVCVLNCNMIELKCIINCDRLRYQKNRHFAAANLIITLKYISFKISSKIFKFYKFLLI